MKSRTNRWLMITISLIMVIAMAASASADTWQNEKLTNNTALPATNLEKWLVGDVRVSNWGSFRFNSFDYTYNQTDNETVLKWHNGTVLPGQLTSACVRTDKNEIKHKYKPRWTYDAADSVVAGPALSHDFVAQGGDIHRLEIGNTTVDGGPLTIQTIQVGSVSTPVTIGQLFFDSLEFVIWTYTDNNVSLATDDSISFTGLSLPSGGAIVYRALVYDDADPTNVVEYTGQYTPTRVPSTTPIGLLVLLALVLLSAVYVMYKKRTTAQTL